MTVVHSQSNETKNQSDFENLNAPKTTSLYKPFVRELYEERVYEAVDYVNTIIGDFKPKVTLILGTGLGSFADTLSDPIIVPTNEIPNFPVSTVSGHAGKIFFGYADGTAVAVFKGRVHAYEGYEPSEVAFGVRVMSLLGTHTLITTNAVGAINESYKEGDLVFVEDIVDKLTYDGCSGVPLGVCGGHTFTDMSEPFSLSLIEKGLKLASDISVGVQKGNLAMKKGPCFETPLEIKVLRDQGADVVGMSVVPEMTAAHQMRVKNVLAISCVSNMAAGVVKGEKIDHEAVQEMLLASAGKYDQFFSELIKLCN